jgi:glyceraldehyde-3-phosphate dehydrogenase/erythrose-4-phosphate dehydrogenase
MVRAIEATVSVVPPDPLVQRQYRFNGCTGSAVLKFERNMMAQMEVSLQAATYTGPSALSLAVTRSEDAGVPLAVRNSVCWLQATSTTNASSPVIAILDEAIGIEKAVLNTTHSYTATQALIDGPSKKGFREGRAAALNMIPSSTGAAIAVTQAYESLAGKFDGISVRVPTPAGSLADITFIAKRNTTVDEVNNTLRAAAAHPRWHGIFNTTDEELVSSDIVGRTEGSIADLSMTRVVDGNLVKVLAWYDNEMGYAHTLVRHVRTAGSQLTANSTQHDHGVS